MEDEFTSACPLSLGICHPSCGLVCVPVQLSPQTPDGGGGPTDLLSPQRFAWEAGWVRPECSSYLCSSCSIRTVPCTGGQAVGTACPGLAVVFSVNVDRSPSVSLLSVQVLNWACRPLGESSSLRCRSAQSNLECSMCYTG